MSAAKPANTRTTGYKVVLLGDSGTGKVCIFRYDAMGFRWILTGLRPALLFDLSITSSMSLAHPP